MNSYYESIGIYDIATRLYFIDMIQFMDSEYVDIVNKSLSKKKK